MRNMYRVIWILLFFATISIDLSAQKMDNNLMLKEVNKVRNKRCKCGTMKFKPATNLIWDVKLEQAAKRHAEDMSKVKKLNHTGSDKSTVAMRVTDENFIWTLVGENIAEGYPDIIAVVSGWMNSPGHCRNIMNPQFTHMGAAVSSDGKYWVQVFATPMEKL